MDSSAFNSQISVMPRVAISEMLMLCDFSHHIGAAVRILYSISFAHSTQFYRSSLVQAKNKLNHVPLFIQR